MILGKLKYVIAFRHFLRRKFWQLYVDKAHRARFRSLIQPERRIPDLCDQDKKSDQLNIACILDEFSFESFKPEAQFVPLSIDWEKQVEEQSFDLLFVESAWRGFNQEWAHKVSLISNELIDVLAYCQDHHIPTVFWHKEVPPHLQTFMRVSRMFDYVFLSDKDCIEKYQHSLGHERVYFMPFACQPAINHPISKTPRQQKAFFAGTYYPAFKYPERHRDFEAILPRILKYLEVDIFDRSGGKGRYLFPEKYKALIRGSLSFSEITEVYRNYLFGINMNSVKQSSSMCARRVFELMSSGTLVVGNFSKAIKHMFGNLTICSDSPDEVEDKLKTILAEPRLAAELQSKALREVLSKHSYKERWYDMLEQMGKTKNESPKDLLCVARIGTNSDCKGIIQTLDRQSYKYFDCLAILSKKVDNCMVKAWEERGFYAVDEASLQAYLESSDYDVVAYLEAKNYYGQHYLQDLRQAFTFSLAPVVTKASWFKYSDNIHLDFDKKADAWTFLNESAPDQTMYTRYSFIALLKQGVLSDGRRQPFVSEAICIDGFHFCRDGSKAAVDDMAQLEIDGERFLKQYLN